MTPDSVTSASDILPFQESQRPRLFHVYNHYRLVISLILAGLLFVDPGTLDTKFREPEFYQICVLAYLTLTVFTAVMLFSGARPNQRHIILSILIDIITLHTLLLFSAGMTSGLANLIIVTVAAGNILTPSRVGLFYAALATIGSLGVATWSSLTFGTNADEIVRAGSLGILYFAAAFLLQNITRRMIRSEQLASSRAQSLHELEQINQQIIQRMRTGIIVTDRFGQVRLANAAAHELLFGDRPGQGEMGRLPPPLRQRLDQWVSTPGTRTEPFQATPITPMLQANFTRLHQERGDHILIFIEDMSKVTLQAQQMKLASLGRLTAGIAHEIRNPLGAISHAAQLLNESPNCDAADRKMVDIIQRHSKRVNDIIENVLDLSRRRQANIDLVQIDSWLQEFVEDYQHGASNGMDGNTPTITLDLPDQAPPARFDKSQMAQVLVNLCDNGLRYSKAQTGKATLKICVGVTGDGERSYIDIQDQGAGISSEKREHIFEPFYTTDQSGTGLGLYLARELCEANQAHLALLDNGRPGSCFRITFAHHGRLI
ncbi:histidine kinase [Marinobacter halodurans]|uniref:histidine kinase n=1 Tax=Marinobacter halodurans TaxID=2528979 RepID=A0ABY1ZKK8_9GAMM|nr:ATP-binding protein [Marinobacter halodurans]TBW50987.1 histidine kinase [Marinobacter halodurans]